MSNLDQIFKAYIITRNKIPARQYTDPTNQYRLAEVQSLPEYAGLLADDAVLVDIDDGAEGERLLDIIRAEKVKCRVHKTDRGMHFFFIGHHMGTTKTRTSSAVGFMTDWKLGTKNGISVLKMHGESREVLYDTDELGPLPAWLYPVKTFPPEFMGMGDGSGRNDALYKYILALQSAGLTKEESREVIRIINTHVLRDPLPERELQTITRDEAFPTESESFYDAKGKLKVRQFEEHFCREVHAIKLDKTLHIYRDGVYVNGDDMIRGRMLEFLPDLSLAQRNEILNRSKDRIQTYSVRAPAYLIAFRNGVYDATDGSMRPHNPDNIITNIIDWNYRTDAYNEVTDRTLDKLACDDPTLRALLEEVIGYCFLRRAELGKAFLFLGKPSGGKSTYLAMLRSVLGTENISSLNIQDLSSRFKPAHLLNKLANIGDDIPDTWVPDPSMFKKVVTGDRIIAEFKGLHEFEFDPYATMIFSANEMPRIDDRTGAVKRRLVPVPFRAVFSPSDPDFDPYIKDKLLRDESIEYLVRLGVEGLERVLRNNGFSTNEAIENELRDIDEMNNPLIGFIEEVGEDGIVNNSTTGVYDRYKGFCYATGLQPVALNSLVRQLNARLGTTVARRMVKGEKCKLFVRKDTGE